MNSGATTNVRRRVFWFNLAAAASVVVLVTTAILWLTHAIRRELDYGFYGRLDFGPRAAAVAGRYVNGGGTDRWRYAGYGLVIERPWPIVRGPASSAPEYLEWERQFRRRDRVVELMGFSWWRWRLMTGSENHSEFQGYEYGVELPYWFVCACSALLPLRWFGRSRRRRRRAARELCRSCGYDLRASPARCPECGAEPIVQVT